MKESEPLKILEEIYESALKESKNDRGKSFLNKLNDNQRLWLFTITNKAEEAKAILASLSTSLTKKIESPNQDIRYHKIELKDGYSARSFDTKYVTPFFKKKFRRLSMKESGWLTRSIEQPSPFDLNFPGKIRDKKIKESFLLILNDVEKNKANPKNYLIGLFILLINKISNKKVEIKHIDNTNYTTISLIIDCLREHFFGKYKGVGASKLPVIAIYSIYKILIKNVSRYKGKTLLPLKSHISSDKKSQDIGDITVIDGKKFFEGVEVKHGIQIDDIIINDAFDKIKNTDTERYYILTTAEPNINIDKKEDVERSIKIIRETHGCEIIVNGIIHSLKYYLRLIPNPSEFIEVYTKSLEKEFEIGTEIKETHISMWKEIIDKNFV